MKKQTIINEVVKIFWIFIIGSIIGWIFETIVVILQKGYFEVRQGLVYGPFIPVYGIGGIMYYIAFKLIRTRSPIKVFFIALVLGGVTEYICSYLQEAIFGSISWDYSNLPFNFNGRTSLLHCTYWGIAGIMYISWIEPLLCAIENIMQDVSLKIITILLAIFILFDVTVSWMAIARQKNRFLGEKPKNIIEIFLDKYYPDDFIDIIFSNKKNKLQIQQ